MLVSESSMQNYRISTILYISRGRLSVTLTTAVENALVAHVFIARSDFYKRSGSLVSHSVSHLYTL